MVKEKIFDVVEHDATRLFCALIASDWRVKVCKCRFQQCGLYFLQESPGRKRYQHGTFCCKAHQNHTSAVLANRRRRSYMGAKQVEIAARELIRKKRTPDWRVNKSQKVQLASDVSARIYGSGRIVTLNWVTRNAEKIDRRRRELSKIG
jgi:hypothetical protein